MPMKRAPAPNEAERLLGQELARLRRIKGVNARDLAKKIRETEQQIKRYEAGAFVPLGVLEAFAEALGEPIQKRDIRRISNLRKFEKEKGEIMPELAEIYAQLFVDIEDL